MIWRPKSKWPNEVRLWIWLWVLLSQQCWRALVLRKKERLATVVRISCLSIYIIHCSIAVNIVLTMKKKRRQVLVFHLTFNYCVILILNKIIISHYILTFKFGLNRSQRFKIILTQYIFFFISGDFIRHGMKKSVPGYQS